MDKQDVALVQVDNIDWLEKKIALINRKNTKHGLPEIELHFGEIVEVMEKVRDETGKIVEVPVIKRKVTIIGEPPVLAGWKVLGTLYHAGDAGNVVNSLPYQTIPEEYRFADGRCDHCGWKRNRKDTFILENTNSGVIQQVGRNCLSDFTSVKDVKGLIHAVDWLVAAKNAVKEATGMGASEGYSVTVRRYLAAAVQAVTDHGWTPKRRGNIPTDDPTYERALEYFHNPKTGKLKHNISGAAFDKADEIIAWALDDLRMADELNDYLHNLMAVVLTDVIDFRRGGALLASGPAAFDRAKDETQPPESNFIGVKGEKVSTMVEVTWIKTLQGNYGTSYLYKFKDEHDNRVCWFASRDQELSVGDFVDIKGTIKALNTYKGVNETQLTRCTINR